MDEEQKTNQGVRPSRKHFCHQENEKREAKKPRRSDRNTRGGVGARDYYSEYHGHHMNHLPRILSHLRETSGEAESPRSVVFLAGDSSLDNKYWFGSIKDTMTSPAVNGYEGILSPKKSVPDVCYWVNKAFVDKGVGSSFCCLNTSIEESLLSSRSGDDLLPQDEFIRDNINTNDVLVVSVGGNDIALHPSCLTALSMVSLVVTPISLVEAGYAIGLGHFQTMFKDQIQHYITKLVKKKKPKLVIVCMIYYPDETPGDSWAETVLAALGYNSNPAKLQVIINKIFTEATSKIEIEGTQVLPFPLFRTLDGKCHEDYCQRVEPSITGGRKIGSALVDAILEKI